MAKSMSHAYQEIRSMILGGKFAPGERLPERVLVEELGVSRTPVREALRRLNSEGLVFFEPNRGARVQEVSQVDIDDLFELGVSLESFAASLAAERANESDIHELEQLLLKKEALVAGAGADFSSDELTSYTELDFQFHSRIVKCSRNKRLEGVVGQVVGLPVLVNVYARYQTDHFVRSSRQHREIFEAIQVGDADWAASAMRNHILTGKHHLNSP